VLPVALELGELEEFVVGVLGEVEAFAAFRPSRCTTALTIKVPPDSNPDPVPESTNNLRPAFRSVGQDLTELAYSTWICGLSAARRGL